MGSPSERTGCFQVWVIVNKATIDTCAQVSVWTYVFSAFG